MEEIQKQLAAEVMKPAAHKYPRRKFQASEVNDVWSADLLDIKEFKEENDGIQYLLVIVDVFSRFAFVQPVQSKNAEEMEKAFKEIYKLHGTPRFLVVDQGTEFYNSKVKALNKREEITMYSIFGDHKSAIAERFIRTLKTNIWKFFLTNNTRRFKEELPKIVKKYNNTKHSTIGMSPHKAKQDKNYFSVLLQSTLDEKKTIAKFQVGDRVRVSRVKDIFEKGYTPNWSIEIFTVVDIKHTIPSTYIIQDFDGEKLTGSFYAEELQKTELKEDIYLIEKVIRKRTVKGKKQWLVKWYGFPDKRNSWVNEKDFV